jgi:hypothetical protein
MNKDEILDSISFLLFILFYMTIVLTNLGKPISLLAIGMWACYMIAIRKNTK